MRLGGAGDFQVPPSRRISCPKAVRQRTGGLDIPRRGRLNPCWDRPPMRRQSALGGPWIWNRYGDLKRQPSGEMVTSIHSLPSKKKRAAAVHQAPTLDSVSDCPIGPLEPGALMTTKIVCAIKVGPSKNTYKMYSCVAKAVLIVVNSCAKPRFFELSCFTILPSRALSKPGNRP